MLTEYSIVTTTTSSQVAAAQIAQALLDQQLAACIQVMPIQSYYRWQGQINIDDEHLLIIKCKQADFTDVQKCILENHSYEIPEIIQLPITAGLPQYLQWISTVTKSA